MTTEISQDTPVALKKPPIYFRKWFIVVAFLVTGPYGPVYLIPTYLAVKSKAFGRKGLVLIYSTAVLFNIAFFSNSKTSPEQLAKQQGAKDSTANVTVKNRQKELLAKGCTTLAEFREAVGGFEKEPFSVKTDDSGKTNYSWYYGTTEKLIVVMSEKEGRVIQIIVAPPMDGSAESVTGALLISVVADAFSSEEFDYSDCLKWQAANLISNNSQATFGTAVIRIVGVFRLNNVIHSNVAITRQGRTR